MPDYTTVRLRTDTKAELDRFKRDTESRDEAVRRLLDIDDEEYITKTEAESLVEQKLQEMQATY